MKRAVLILIFLLGFAAVVQAQVVTTNSTFTWTQPSVADAAAAQAMEYRFRDNGGAFLVVPAVTCTLPAANTAACSAKLTAAIVSLINGTSGVHNTTLSAYQAGVPGLESAQSLPFVLTVGPAVPTGFKIIP